MRAAFLASILPRIMKEGKIKEGSSHFDKKTLNLIGHYGRLYWLTNGFVLGLKSWSKFTTKFLPRQLKRTYLRKQQKNIFFLAKTMAWHSFPPHNQSESSLPIDFRIGLSADLAKIRRICLYVYISLHGPMNSTISSFGLVAFFQQHWIFNPHMSYSSLFKSKNLSCIAMPIKVPIPHFHLEWLTTCTSNDLDG